VKSKGKAKTKQIAKDLDIPRKKVDEYAEILAENRLVELKYLPFGGIMLNLREEKK
jgi:Mn-dependent DtxR family transcriptional regulator